MTGLTSMRYWGDIELPDEDELAEDSADLRPIDATSQPECKDDEQ